MFVGVYAANENASTDKTNFFINYVNNKKVLISLRYLNTLILKELKIKAVGQHGEDALNVLLPQDESSFWVGLASSVLIVMGIL